MANTEIAKILKEMGTPPRTRTLQELKEFGYDQHYAKPLPYFVLTETGKRQTKEVALRMRIGNLKNPGLKVIGWYGPPGTGKNTLAEEIAACLGIPYREFDLGQGSDLVELIGGTGLRANDGATETTPVQGPLTEAARIGSVIAINEIVNVDGIQLSVLHSMIQERQINLPSAEPGDTHHISIPVHLDTFFVFTWNPDLRNPDRQMPPPALLDRLRARNFPADSREDETNKLEAFLLHHASKHVNIEAIKKDVRLIRELREEYEKGGLARCPYMRTLQDFALTRIELDEQAAFEVLLNLCDQDPQELQRQRKEILCKHFEPLFGIVRG